MCQPTEPADQSSRVLIFDCLDRNFLVEAAAGTGKTTSMVRRMVNLVRTGTCSIDTIAAVTFTRKATAELRERFHARLEEARHSVTGVEAERLAQAWAHRERCFIGTIHSFCGRLLRERPVEAGVDLGFRELDETEDLAIREQAWLEFVASAAENCPELMDDLLASGIELHQLQSAFLKFASYPDVTEWATGSAELPDIDLLVGYLRPYLQEIKDVAENFPQERGNDKLMDKYEEILRAARQANLADLISVMDLLNLFNSKPYVTQKYWPGGKEVGKLHATRWDEFRELIAPHIEQWLQYRHGVVLATLKRVVEVYDRRREETGGLNFGDLLLKAAALLKSNPEVREYFAKRFTHLLVDEFQDTDPIQAEVVLLLTSDDHQTTEWRECRPRSGSLFVVGDPKQSIYRFRRADIVTYEEVKRIIVDHGGQVLPLTTNFRTIPLLVNWGNDVFSNLFPPQSDRYNAAACSMQAGRATCDPPEKAPGRFEGLYSLEFPEDLKSERYSDWEAEAIAKTIRKAIDQGWTVGRTSGELAGGVSHAVRPGDFMIITLKKEDLSTYGTALESLGIPYETTGGNPLLEMREYEQLIAILRCLARPEDPIALVAVLRSALFGFSDTDLYRFKRLKGSFSFWSEIPDALEHDLHDRFADVFQRLVTYSEWLNRLTLPAAVEKILENLGLLASALTSSGGLYRSGALVKVLEMLRVLRGEIGSPDELVAWLEELILTRNNSETGTHKHEFQATAIAGESSNHVRIMNLHKSKGLEAPVVFLAGATGGSPGTPVLHVDRSSRDVQGFLAVTETRERSTVEISHPAGWQIKCDEEQRFLDAERNRLLYVAATRAGAGMIITRRNKGAHYSAWNPFFRFMENAIPLLIPAEVAVPELMESLTVSDNQIEAARVAIEARWQYAAMPSYSVEAAKQAGPSIVAATRETTAEEAGAEWGTVIHMLLEAAIRNPAANLHSVAKRAFRDLGQPVDWADPALETVKAVLASRIWQRAERSRRRLVEVPFTLKKDPADTAVLTLQRGVIDLAFEEDGGWVIVDYKTDSVASGSLPSFVDHYRPQLKAYAESWTAATGQPVKEAGLYFIRANEYLTVNLTQA